MSSFLPKQVLRRNRALSELMRLCRTVISDGHVTEEETRAFRQWVEDNPDMLGVSPVNQIVPLLREIFGDEVVSVEELDRFLELLQRLTGEDGKTAEEFGKFDRATGD